MPTAPTPCPLCGRPALRSPENRSHPFCSDRCRLIDLGNWLGESYRIPGPRAGDGAEVPPRPVDGEEEGS
ncbi:DNA gyrase inhibitor YacG [Anaeromyxobacter oryzisoli]|uniref:DNA gyrase inhibitor YacG n=1 Tax=Anaeromyxobacter oryzisoli TaxID=2925408 RepID=UPI001F58DAA6|nr:DNA gyrase inhibitor YacG [Anaeromyxobacter sp. SG63]